MQRFCFLASLIQYLKHETLLSREQAAEMLGGEDSQCNLIGYFYSTYHQRL